MVSTDKKSRTRPVSTTMRRSAKRQHDQTLEELHTKADAEKRRARLQDPRKQEKYAADFRMLDKLDDNFRGELSYKLLGNKRLWTDNPGELTRQHGMLSRTKKVLERDASTGTVHVSRYERESKKNTSLYQFDKDGALSAKEVTRRGGRFQEKWERDENGELIRTRYVNRTGLKGLFQPVSEEISASSRTGPEDRSYRTLTRRRGSMQEIYERSDKGNLELIGSLSNSKHFRRAADHRTSQTDIRKLGGAFSKSYRSLLDTDGNELGRDIASHRRLLNKRSATYDEGTGALRSTKHTFGKLYKSEAVYLSSDAKTVSKKILGVTVGKRLRSVSEREREAQNLRAVEAARHKEAWQERYYDAKSEFGKTEQQPGTLSASSSGSLEYFDPPSEFGKTEQQPGTLSASSSGSLEYFDAQTLVGVPEPGRQPEAAPASASASASEHVSDPEEQTRLASLLRTPVPHVQSAASAARSELHDRPRNDASRGL
ncbi:effector protein [Bradyrhizobium sp. CCGUVB23]|uniref:effector protein n=1 Tax=Bradyrhizobium sp. CCGUVB23 TaxID=2949630 RepID=UPI0020B1B51A|nr:effector protein [Bradyrhizobium sp. CCGUVB23]MCP3468621.1 effector protein [Bradyrhizobium sp. CCGUVB23]